MKIPKILFSIMLVASCVVSGASQVQKSATRNLMQVYANNDFQITGIAVSKSGRLFVNFPRWSDQYLNAVVEVKPDGSVQPFPDEHWNRWDLKTESADSQFVCVQSVVVDDADNLWVLDPAVPMLATFVPGGPKLVKISLKSNRVQRVYAFGSDIIKNGTYLNDVRFDARRHTAYITDSGVGGIIVLNLETGKARRTLDGNPSVMVEVGVQVVVDGKPLLAFGKPPQFQSDSIELSPDRDYLYYKAITAESLYRIKTDILRNEGATPDQLGAAVEKVGTTFPTDGFWMDAKGNLYLSDVTHNAVTRRSPDGVLESIVVDDKLQWPDSFAEGPDGDIYISASHINESPRFNDGKSVRKTPYAVFKFKP